MRQGLQRAHRPSTYPALDCYSAEAPLKEDGRGDKKFGVIVWMNAEI